MRGLLTIILLSLFSISDAQNYGDKDYYLIDSLNLDEVSPEHKLLIDSCMTNYHNTSSDSLKLEMVGHIVDKCWDINIWPAYNVIWQKMILKELSKEISHDYYSHLQGYYSSSLNNEGFLANRQGNPKKALYYYEKSLSVLLQNHQLEMAGYQTNNIASIHYSLGDIEKSLKYHRISLQIHQSAGNQRGIGGSATNIASIYAELGDTAAALKYYNVALKIYEDQDEIRGTGLLYGNIGNLYAQLGDLDLAMVYCRKGYELLKGMGEKNGEAKMLHSIGYIHYDKGDLDSALYYFETAFDLFEKIQDKRGLSVCYSSIAKIKYEQKSYVEAEKYGLLGYQYANEIDMPEKIKESSAILSLIYKELGNYKAALEYQTLHITMRDSLKSVRSIQALTYQQSQYEYGKQKALDKAKHSQELERKQQEKERQSIITYASLGGLILVGLLLFVVFNRLKVTRKQKATIEEQKSIVEDAHFKLEEKNQEILDSINYAKRIQTAILPPDKILKKYLPDSFVLYKPKDIVAGDFYWLEGRLDSVIFAAADCTGHGVPGAMVSVICNNGLNRSVREFELSDPGQILDKTREIVVSEFEKSEEEVKDGMDIALCSLKNNILKYAGANNPLWLIRDEELIEYVADKQPVGKYDQISPYTTHQIEVLKGDTFYIFSDGYVDQFGGPKGKKFKAKNLKELLLSIQHLSMEDQKIKLDETFEKWKGNLEQLDDVCVIGVRVC